MSSHDFRGGPGADSIPGAVEIPVVGRLVDRVLHLESIRRDLVFARDAIERLLANMPAPVRDIDDFDVGDVALFQAAAIAYGRCFGTGLRYAAAIDLVPIGEHRQWHDLLLRVRGEHIAHNIRGTSHELTKAVVLVNVTARDELLVTVQIRGSKGMFFRRDVLEHVRDLVTDVGLKAGHAKDTAVDALLDAMRSQVSQAELRRRWAAGTSGTVRLDDRS